MSSNPRAFRSNLTKHLDDITPQCTAAQSFPCVLGQQCGYKQETHRAFLSLDSHEEGSNIFSNHIIALGSKC